MTSLAFDYVRPESVEEALGLVAARGSVVLAGGQSLVPLLNRRLVRPERVIDITRIATLRTIEPSADSLQIGAAVRLAEIERHPALTRLPLLAEAIASTASPAIRNRATLVGNLVRANAMSELCVVCVALDARLVIGQSRSTRTIAVTDFLKGHHASAVDACEIVLRLEIPWPTGSSGAAFAEIAARAGTVPLVSVAAIVEADASGVITKARIVAGGISGKPIRCTNCEAALTGRSVTAAVGAIVTEAITPEKALPEAAYALDVLPVVISRAVARAVDTIRPT
jgi:aerobic carbon-monoxide dehydrogenase medium subunit